MTFCLRLGKVDADVANGDIFGFFYISAVTSFSIENGGTLTKHRLDSGAEVNDHYIPNNPKFKLDGVISSADITYNPSNTNSIIGQILGEGVMNGDLPPKATTIDTSSSGIMQYVPDILENMIPDVVAQFLPVSDPEIVVDEDVKPLYGDQFAMLIREMTTRITYNPTTALYQNSIVPCALYELRGNDYVRVYEDLIITSFIPTETPDSGDALTFSMTLEQMRFVRSIKDTSSVAQEMAKKVAQSNNKGKTDSTTKSKTEDTEEAKKNKDYDEATLKGILSPIIDAISRGAEAVVKGAGVI